MRGGFVMLFLQRFQSLVPEHDSPCVFRKCRGSFAILFDMKKAGTEKSFLDLAEINSIMPPELKLNSERYSRGVYRAANGCLISVSNSRVYTKGNMAWYYVYADRYADLGVKYMLFTIGLLGFVLVPMDVFQTYKQGCYWKEGLMRGEKRYRVDVAKKNGVLLFVNNSQRHQRELDLTSFFYPFSI